MPALLSIEALQADRLYVAQKLAEASPAKDPWGTTRHMWQSRLADLDREIAEQAADRSNYASVALIFDGSPVIGSSDIRLDFTTAALDSYQSVVSAALASSLAEALPKRGPLPGAGQSRLYIRDLVHGSVGFILEEVVPDQTELLPTPLKNAVENATRLLTTLSAASDDDFEAALDDTQPRLLVAFQKFARLLHDSGASAKIMGDEHRLVLTTGEVGRLSRRLGEIEVTENVEWIDGRFEGVLPNARECELTLPAPVPGSAPVTIRATISRELADRYRDDPAFIGLLLLKPVRAQIRVVRLRGSGGRVISERRVLEGLEPAAPPAGSSPTDSGPASPPAQSPA